jgi:hypothetical protein
MGLRIFILKHFFFIILEPDPHENNMTFLNHCIIMGIQDWDVFSQF